MTALGIDTAGSACAVALWRGGAVLASVRRGMTRGHAEALMPLIETALGEAKTDYADLTALGVTTGPGSFTGVRTGLAAARGLALALDLPLCGVTSFAAIADDVARRHPAVTAQSLVIILETRRTDFFIQEFAVRGGVAEPAGAPAAQDAEAVVRHIAAAAGGCLIAGDGVDRLRDLAELPEMSTEVDGCAAPDPARIAERAASARPGETPVKPLYIHPPQAAVPRNQGRLRA